MLDNINIENILFLDVETVPQVFEYEKLDDVRKKLWDSRFRFLQNETPEMHYKKAGIYAEFAKIVCISVGRISGKSIRIKSFCGEEEKIILQEFSAFLKKTFSVPFKKKESKSMNKNAFSLCAHNGKEFDFPFIARRLLINGFSLPECLDIGGKRPWETDHLLDTLELWKFGDYKNYTSLNLLASVFGIETPKDDMDGSEVAGVFYLEKNIERIRKYCQKDVLTVIRLFLRFKGEPNFENNYLIEEN